MVTVLCNCGPGLEIVVEVRFDFDVLDVLSSVAQFLLTIKRWASGPLTDFQEVAVG